MATDKLEIGKGGRLNSEKTRYDLVEPSRNNKRPRSTLRVPGSMLITIGYKEWPGANAWPQECVI